MGGTLHDSQARWLRLERYARWRRGGRRCWLLVLPDDALACVVSRLRAADVDALACALLGHATFTLHFPHVAAVPAGMRGTWLRHRMERELWIALHAFADGLLHHACEVRSVCAFVDWSVFAAWPTHPVAEYAWCQPAPHDVAVAPRALETLRPRVRVYDHVVRRHVAACLKSGRPAVRVSFHAVCETQAGQCWIVGTPIAAHLHVLYPHELLREPWRASCFEVA